MSALPCTVKLDLFEGPLDLLLHLIKKSEVEITDIPIATITDQYLAMIEGLSDLNLDNAGEYLVMAATLTFIKSRMLLPPVPGGDDEVRRDPRTSSCSSSSVPALPRGGRTSSRPLAPPARLRGAGRLLDPPGRARTAPVRDATSAISWRRSAACSSVTRDRSRTRSSGAALGRGLRARSSPASRSTSASSSGLFGPESTRSDVIVTFWRSSARAPEGGARAAGSASDRSCSRSASPPSRKRPSVRAI
jgi:hypothetical protein